MKSTTQGIKARYQQIAADIATKIINNQYQIGDKIYTRSLIASQYAVSSETARKAIAILADFDIVEPIKGSGVIIKSCDNAFEFLKQFQDSNTLTEIKQDTISRLNRLMEQGKELRDTVESLVAYSDQFKTLNPFSPFSVYVQEGSPCTGRNLSSLNFWQNTFATVIAIRRQGSLIKSPGPDVELMADDTVYFIVEDEYVQQVDEFINPK